MDGRIGIAASTLLLLLATGIGRCLCAGMVWQDFFGPAWEYRLLHQDNGERIQRLPLAPDSLASAGLIFYCHEQSPAPSSVLFLEAGTERALPQFFQYADSTLRFGVPLAAPGKGRWPTVALMMESKVGPSKLLVFQPPAGAHDDRTDHGFRPLPLDGAASTPEGRVLLPPAAIPQLIQQRSLLLAFGDLSSERPGLEALVQNWWESRAPSCSVAELALIGVEDWRVLWRLPLPNTLGSLISCDTPAGWIGVTRATGNGRSASGMSDDRGWLLQIDTHGQILQHLAVPGCESPAIELGLLDLPGGERFLLLVSGESGSKTGGRLELRQAGDFALADQQRLAGALEAVILPLPDGDGAWRVAVQTQEQHLVLLDAGLDSLAAADPGETFNLLGCGPLGSGRPAPAFGLALGTSGGRLLLFDEDLRELTDQHVWSGAIHARTSALARHRFPVYLRDSAWVWGINTNRGSLHGTWTARTGAHRLAIFAGVSVGLALLLWALVHITFRWRQVRAVARTLFSESPDGVLILDRQFRLLDCNERIAPLLGLGHKRERKLARRTLTRLGKWLGAPASRRPRLDDLVRGRELEELWRHLKGAKREDGHWVVMIDQQPVDFLFRFQPIRGERLQHGWALILQDVTRQLDEHRREVWRMLAQNAAHRIKTPLQRLTLQAESIVYRLMEHELQPMDGAATLAMQAKAEEIVEGASEINQVIRDFLTASDHRIQLQAIRLDEFLRRHVEKYREKYARPEVSITLTVEEGLPLIQADTFHLLSVLLNLLDNALKAIRERGGIQVRALRGENPDGIRLEVEDDGEGIPPERLQQIFTPHYSSFTGGHGLGLAIVRNIVEAHGGKIGVRSQVGSGACFYIDLPCRAREE